MFAESEMLELMNQIATSNGDPENLISVTAGFKAQSVKLMRQAQRKQHEAVATAYAIYTTAKNAGKLDALVAAVSVDSENNP